MRGKPGYEHLNEPLHILVEAELPVEIIDARLMQAREILEDLLKPVVIYHSLQYMLCPVSLICFCMCKPSVLTRALQAASNFSIYFLGELTIVTTVEHRARSTSSKKKNK